MFKEHIVTEYVCTTCNGSGEGPHEGSMCPDCGGLGVENWREEPDWDMEREERILEGMR